MTSRRPALPLAAVATFFAAVLLTGAPAALAQSPSQARSSQLHDALKLTAGQEPAWRAFLLASQPGPQQQAQAQATARLAPTLPTPRRLALIRSQLQSDLVAFDRTAQAVNAFYGQLTPSQQAAFDSATRGPSQGDVQRR